MLKDLKKMFPNLAEDIVVDYKFCGAFGSTDNNLGLIGQTENKSLYYFLSAGANGIINAVYGVKIIEDLLNEKPNKFAKLFNPLR